MGELAAVELAMGVEKRIDAKLGLGPYPARRSEPSTERGVVESRSIAAASSPGVTGVTSSPVSPSTTSSGSPPTRDATTGSPAAIASKTEIGRPSERVERTKT